MSNQSLNPYGSPVVHIRPTTRPADCGFFLHEYINMGRELTKAVQNDSFARSSDPPRPTNKVIPRMATIPDMHRIDRNIVRPPFESARQYTLPTTSKNARYERVQVRKSATRARLTGALPNIAVRGSVQLYCGHPKKFRGKNYIALSQ